MIHLEARLLEIRGDEYDTLARYLIEGDFSNEDCTGCRLMRVRPQPTIWLLTGDVDHELLSGVAEDDDGPAPTPN